MSQPLHDRDFLLWIEDTIAKLRARDFEQVDLENLIEEVEGLGISQRKEMLSRMTVLLEHLFKRLFVPLPEDFQGWERTIRNQRTELKVLFKQVPSLKSRWDACFSDAVELALEATAKEYKQISFPDRWPYASDIDTMLNTDFWEEQP